MPSVSVAQRKAMAIAEHAPGKLYKRNRSLLSMTHEQLHDFASTPEKGLPMEKKNWIAGAIKHKGSLRAAAKKSGMSTKSFAKKHEHDSGKTGARSRLAETLMHMNH